MRLGIALIFGAIFCFMAGCKGFSDSLKFREPVTITARDFLSKRPAEGWYRITNATMILTEAKFSVYKSKYDTSTDDDISQASDIYLPVHAGDDVDSKTALVLKTEDPAIKQTLVEIGEKDAETDDAKIKAWLEKNEDRIIVRRDITGMVAAGIDDSSSDRAELAKLGEELGANFLVLNEGQQPTGAGMSIGLMIGGVVLAFLGLASFAVRLFGLFKKV
jgi:hypothetical protein